MDCPYPVLTVSRWDYRIAFQSGSKRRITKIKGTNTTGEIALEEIHVPRHTRNKRVFVIW
jgi:hypothetical protein